MGLGFCKNQCIIYEKSSKHLAYDIGGCFCKNCDYYFKDGFSRCPCCNSKVRRTTRSNRNKYHEYIL